MRPLFSRQRAAELAAVNLYGNRAEVGQVRRNGSGRPVVNVCAQFPNVGDEVETLQRLRREAHLDRFSCATLLPARQYQLQLIDAPNVPEAEMKSAVRWRLKDFLEYPVETATVDVVAIPADQAAANRGRSVYAVSARNQDIEARMKMFAQAKIPLRVIEVAEMAQRNLATLFESDQRALAMLSFSEEGGLLTFSARGELYLSRRIEISLDQLVDVRTEVRDQLFERIALELQRSLDHFDRQFSNIPLARLLLAPLPEELGLSAYLAGNLSAPVEPVNLGDVLDFHEVPELREPTEQMMRWQTLGTALRVESA
ncbi:MAG: agglutinin biogenesis protein MshI [Betaproteobacteria bacterium]|nr:agglutinin biogenesis protein MshI [Betaproteobacteria bacterium]